MPQHRKNTSSFRISGEKNPLRDSPEKKKDRPSSRNQNVKANNTGPKKTLFRRPTLRSEEAEEFFGNLLCDENEIDELIHEKELFDALDEHEKEECAAERRDSINRRLSFLNNKLDTVELAELLLDDEFLLDLKEVRKNSSKGSTPYDNALSTTPSGLSNALIQRLSAQRRPSLMVKRSKIDFKLDLGSGGKAGSPGSSQDIIHSTFSPAVRLAARLRRNAREE